MADLGAIAFAKANHRRTKATHGGRYGNSTPFRAEPQLGAITGVAQVDGTPQSTRVNLFRADMTPLVSTQSKADGSFRFDGLTAGQYIVIVEGHKRFRPKLAYYDVPLPDMFRIRGALAEEARNLPLAMAGNVTVDPTQTVAGGSSSLLFPGDESCLILPVDASLNAFSEAFEVSAYVRPTPVPSALSIIATCRATNTADQGYIFAANGNTLRVVIYSAGGSAALDYSTPTAVFTSNTWVKVAMRRLGSNISLYKDDVLVGAVQTPASAISETSAYQTVIGRDPSAVGRSWAGNMYDVRMRQLA